MGHSLRLCVCVCVCVFVCVRLCLCVCQSRYCLGRLEGSNGSDGLLNLAMSGEWHLLRKSVQAMMASPSKASRQYTVL